MSSSNGTIKFHYLKVIHQMYPGVVQATCYVHSATYHKHYNRAWKQKSLLGKVRFTLSRFSKWFLERKIQGTQNHYSRDSSLDLYYVISKLLTKLVK